MRITVLALQKLGDFIQALPLIAGLREFYPQAAVNLGFQDQSVKAAASVFFPELNLYSLDPSDFGKNAPPELSEPDLLANLSLNERNLALSDLLKPKEIIGPKLSSGRLILPPLQKLAFAAMAAERRLGRLNLADIWRSFHLPAPLAFPAPYASPLSENLQSHLRKMEERKTAGGASFIAVHLGAGGRLRRLDPLETASALAAAGKRAPLKIALIGSRPERSLSLKFIKALSESAPDIPAVDLAGETSLSDLIGLFRIADLFISGDTGTAHLAAAAGASQLSLFFGPAYAHETAPASEKAFILQGLAPCGPCLDASKCPFPGCPGRPGREHIKNMILCSLSKRTSEDFQSSLKPEAAQAAFQSFQGSFTPDYFRLRPAPPYSAVLDDTELAALIFQKASWKLILKDNKAGASLDPDLLKGYRKNDRAFSEKNIIRTLFSIADKGLDAKEERRLFIEYAGELLSRFLKSQTAELTKIKPK